jgi:stage II sporulation SpoE-like protein/GAF domain-containing protein
MASEADIGTGRANGPHSRHRVDDDETRVRALEDLGVLDTGPEERFDRITGLARRLFGVASAAITLIDRDRQYIKSNEGTDLSHGPRDEAFCDHTIRQPDTLVVEDASIDARFADNPLVTDDPHVRFYAGHPLEAPGGYRVGALCLLDDRPRTFTEPERALLEELAEWVQQELTRSEELEHAAQVQRGLLPRRPPRIRGYDVAGACLPSRGVGGDFLDWYPTRDGGLALTIADVMGKGMAAAIVMAMVRTAMRSVGRLHQPAVAVREAADTLHEDLEETGTLVTLCHAVLHPDDDVVRYVDAGHGLMLLVRADGSLGHPARGGLPLGVMSEVDRNDATVALRPGDVAVAFSDGLLDLYPGPLPQALNELARVVHESPDSGEIVRRFTARARRAALLDDDVTVVAIRRLP